ncbi:MAG: hypothetical protein F6J97_10755 [Leptolyngbya sp. SIO4C1]|nr:hypothetical protein [Leptolyngbya sp. SIO4C1]
MSQRVVSAIAAFLLPLLGQSVVAQAPDESAEPSRSLQSQTDCPEDLAVLTQLLLRDLPGYANRVLQRALGEVPDPELALSLEQYRPPTVLIAGEAERKPIDVAEQVYTTDISAMNTTTQLFFTTLEREYSGTRFNDIQHFHWLFLVPSETGWRLAFMFSTIDDTESLRPILPLRESSGGSIGQAVQLWLRDCRAGTVRSPVEE